MECHGFVSDEWNVFVPAFDWDKNMEWNGSIMHSVGRIEE
jgi:hypothetical protein